MKTIKKSMGLAAMITAGLLVAGMAPEVAMAHPKKAKAKASSSKVIKHSRAVTTTTTASSSSSADRRLRALEDEVTSLRSELNRSRSEARAEAQAAVQQVEAKQQEIETKLAREEEGNDLLFFRGGYARMEHARGNELLTGNATLSAAAGTPNPGRSGEGWYVGAGFDHRLTNDLWGMSDMVAVDGEVMFQYMNFGSNVNGFVSAQLAGLGAGTSGMKNQVTQFTLSASPKIKFNLMDGDLRPWIIPFGLSINVISPPASGVTVLNPGLMLGTGVEYRIWKSLWAGVDFRYNFTGDDLNYRYRVGNTTILNKTDTDGFTTGAFLGFGF
jgi:opacity protein-like surface antigen